MPEYSYSCDPQDGGCGYLFTVFQKVSEYKQLKRCPNCRKHKLVRDLSSDNISCSVKVSSGAKTLGHLAELNSNRLSGDQKDKLKKGHNAYREKKDELPVKGERIKKSKTKPWYKTNNDVQGMTPTQQKNYIRTGKKNG